MTAGSTGPVIDVVVVAAGSSRRMGGLDKILAPLAGRPLLAWTLEALAAARGVERIVVVTATERVAELAAEPWLPSSVTAVVAGGARRQESVAAGVGALGLDTLRPEAVGRPRVVLVHDGARPLVSPALTEAVAVAAADHGAAIPVVPIAETIKRIEAGRVAGTVDRTPLAAAQTPQGVRAELLLRAYEECPPDGPVEWTDEASLLEACRIPVHAIPGEPMNLKVTLPDDLRRAEALLAARGPQSAGTAAAGALLGLRAGYGDDAHPFGPGGPLALGGVVFEGAPKLHGHSDGDVVLHAIADALLGAAGLGDLGSHFPATSATPKGIASTELLLGILARVREAGFEPASLDLTIVASRPRLGGRLAEMRATVAGLLGLPESDVNIKASTGNLIGPEGAGRAISARAVALVRPIHSTASATPDTSGARGATPA